MFLPSQSVCFMSHRRKRCLSKWYAGTGREFLCEKVFQKGRRKCYRASFEFFRAPVRIVPYSSCGSSVDRVATARRHEGARDVGGSVLCVGRSLQRIGGEWVCARMEMEWVCVCAAVPAKFAPRVRVGGGKGGARWRRGGSSERRRGLRIACARAACVRVRVGLPGKTIGRGKRTHRRAICRVLLIVITRLTLALARGLGGVAGPRRLLGCWIRIAQAQRCSGQSWARAASGHQSNLAYTYPRV
ncbi:hypothetical protein B0H10DRAFT_2124286, partial [Mycena sp. CBHHK59/15]